MLDKHPHATEDITALDWYMAIQSTGRILEMNCPELGCHQGDSLL
jgi:hypothetical protein